MYVAAPLQAAETKFKYGGYVKFDAMASYYNNGEVGPLNPLRDFYIPALVPVGDRDGSFDVDFHVKQSRFNLETKTTFDGSRQLRAYLEMDFLLSNQGNERVSNSFNPRMRHFFFQTGHWLFGQTWTTFQIVILPEALDFIGVPDGTIFGRQPQVRFTYGPWQLALENPSTTVTPHLGGIRTLNESGGVPDLVGRRDLSGDWGKLSVAAIARQLHYTENSDSIRESSFGYGLTLGSEMKVFSKDDLKFQVTGGSGLGRYLALNFASAAVLDADSKLHNIDTVCGFIAYRHFWSEQWRSTIDVAAVTVNNPTELTGGGVNKDAHSVSANLLYSPRPKLTLGLEYMFARRVLEDDTEGSFNRLQFSARYDFGFVASE
jgi:hypothetical protein